MLASRQLSGNTQRRWLCYWLLKLRNVGGRGVRFIGWCTKKEGRLLIEHEMRSTGVSPAPKQCSPVALNAERSTKASELDDENALSILIGKLAARSDLKPSTKDVIPTTLMSQTD
eukprot:TRINITY_DN25508_c0_g2_i1.p1 TRINITY_DN25508_c0_g2~~TRINITY_DN25508_c0_g2_i1.p1  ORF type:complete len:115 (+),score=12.80 TRINITY_DN25508_c0_g2_i1:222-566(+)